MLAELHVVNLGVIEDLTIQLDHGMTVISGETGAGKTLIVDALLLLCGARADPGIIRNGTRFARAEARFVSGGQETVIARHVDLDGPSRAYVNGNLSRAADLAHISAEFLDVYGQHDAQSLFSKGTQGQTLDLFSSIDYQALSELKNSLRQARHRLSGLGGDERARERELALLKSEADELISADLKDPEEDQNLVEQIEKLSHIQENRDILQQIYSALIERDAGESAMDLLGLSRSCLQRVNGFDELLQKVKEQIDLLREIGSDISSEIDLLDSDPGRLESLHLRLAQITKLKRRFGDTLDQVIEYRDRTVTRIDELTFHEMSATKVEEEISGLLAEIAREESAILEKRLSGASVLAHKVTQRLASLALDGAKFAVHVGSDGVGDPVTFMFSANRGEKMGPIAKVASGGELSRAMLAIRLVSGSDVPTMVFDEVDAGIGGKTAVQVGKALSELSHTKQVIVVTHLGQVASFAQSHIAISKNAVDDRVVISGRQVSGEERVEEVARMLSGHADSEKAKAHAKELLSNKNC